MADQKAQTPKPSEHKQAPNVRTSAGAEEAGKERSAEEYGKLHSTPTNETGTLPEGHVAAREQMGPAQSLQGLTDTKGRGFAVVISTGRTHADHALMERILDRNPPQPVVPAQDPTPPPDDEYGTAARTGRGLTGAGRVGAGYRGAARDHADEAAEEYEEERQRLHEETLHAAHKHADKVFGRSKRGE